MENNSQPRFKFINDSFTPAGDRELLSKKIGDIGLTPETAKLLTASGINTVEELCKCQMKHLYRVRNIGKKHVFEVLRKLQSMGLDFMRAPKAERDDEQSSQVISTKTIDKNNQKKPHNADKNVSKQAKKDNKKNSQDIEHTSHSAEVGAAQHKDKQPQIRDNGQDSKESKDKKKEIKAQKQDKKSVQPQSKLRDTKRVKLNSYEIDVTPVSNISKTKKLREDRNNKLVRLINSLPPIKNADGLYKFYKQGKWGYKDAKGNVVIEPAYSEAFNFHEGMACVEIDERCGFINTAGELIIDIKYDTACSFSEGLASVSRDGKCGYIDKEGKVIFPFEYESATSFENGIALVKKDGKWGYMDRETGEIRLR